MDNFFKEPLIVENLEDLSRAYHHLLTPVKDIEMLCEYKNRKEVELNEARGTLASKIITTLALAIQFTFTLAVPFIVIFALFIVFKKTPEGIRYITVYEGWFVEKFELLDKFALYLQAHIGMTLGSIIGVILTFAFFFAITPVALLLFPAMLVIAIVITFINCIKASMEVRNLPKEIAKVDADIDDEINRIALVLELVPPDYRCSSAIEFFCKAFDNKKADSLKEAMTQYDDYAHKLQLEYTQQELLEKNNEMIRMLATQNDRIDALKREVGDIDWKVSWL